MKAIRRYTESVPKLLPLLKLAKHFLATQVPTGHSSLREVPFWSPLQRYQRKHHLYPRPKDGWVFDSLFFKLNIKTNSTLFHWSALEAGIPFADSQASLTSKFRTGTKDSPWDWFHMNSAQSVGNGYLVNSRYLWTTFKLNSTGDIEWNIQAKYLASILEMNIVDNTDSTQGDTGGDFILPDDGHFVRTPLSTPNYL